MIDEEDQEDIVKDLENWAYIVDQCQGKANLVMLSGHVFQSAADEIKRLREAGDNLALGIRNGRWDDALDAWEDIRNDSK
jgi:hypothetical protein